MVAGVPGVGISGIFYLVCAFLMPFIEIGKTVRGRSSKKRWKLVMRQFGIFCGIMGGSWGVGLLLAYLLHYSIAGLSAVVNFGQTQHANVFRIQPLFLSLITMSVLFTGLSVYNVILDIRSGKAKRK